jgi:dTDP-4-amino-4,6-dideoxygalactose transaminase
VELPAKADWADPVWHLYVIRTPDRDGLISQLSHKNIGVLVHYPIPPHLSNAYKDIGHQRGDFPITEAIAESALSLPLHPFLKMQDVDVISEVIHKFLSNS